MRGVREVGFMRITRISVFVLALAASVNAQAIKAGKTKTGIAYDIQGKGPVVVLITGANLDRRMWAREVEWLAPSFTVVRYDLRAHGQSDTATVPFDHLSDLWALLDELAIPKATLIGLSAGSTIALDAALDAPSRVERMVLVGPAPSGFMPKEPLPFAGDLMSALKARDYKKVTEVLLATSVFAAPPESQALVRQMVTENDRMWTIPREMLKSPARPAVYRLEEVKVPTLIMIGENDTFQQTPAMVMTKYIPGAKLVAVKGGGHLLNLTSPVEFRAAVLDFLK
jgi:3-oxoadipate enol-lactonase